MWYEVEYSTITTYLILKEPHKNKLGNSFDELLNLITEIKLDKHDTIWCKIKPFKYISKDGLNLLNWVVDFSMLMGELKTNDRKGFMVDFLKIPYRYGELVIQFLVWYDIFDNYKKISNHLFYHKTEDEYQLKNVSKERESMIKEWDTNWLNKIL